MVICFLKEKNTVQLITGFENFECQTLWGFMFSFYTPSKKDDIIKYRWNNFIINRLQFLEILYFKFHSVHASFLPVVSSQGFKSFLKNEKKMFSGWNATISLDV